MFRNILIPIDPDHADLFDKQVALAQRVLAENGAISTVYVNQNYIHHAMAATSPERPTEIEEAVLARIRELFLAEVPDAQRGQVYCRRGVVHDEILQQAKKMQADLIILAACKKPLERYFLGSNSRKVMMEAKCSVFVQR